MAIRFLLAFAFLLITVLSMAQPENPLCDESVSISQGGDLNQSICVASDSTKDDSQQNHDHHTSCHNCHIGHCLFTLAGSSNFKFYTILDKTVFFDQKIILSTFKTLIDRPPIS